MSEIFKNIIGLINPVGAQREQINLLTLEKSQLISLISEMKSHISTLVSEKEALESQNNSKSKEIEELTNRLNYVLKQNSLRNSVVPIPTKSPFSKQS